MVHYLLVIASVAAALDADTDVISPHSTCTTYPIIIPGTAMSLADCLVMCMPRIQRDKLSTTERLMSLLLGRTDTN